MIRAGDLEKRFDAAGLRITPQRALLFRLIEEAQAEHPSAESLHRRAAREMPSISLRTVYAILEELREVRAVRPLDLGTGAARFCTTGAPHSHLVCEGCGRVRDVFLETGPVPLPAQQRAGFVVKEQTIVFRGLCADCLRPA
ncbi:MAG: Fur family transcriptional regulator [bacterium]